MARPTQLMLLATVGALIVVGLAASDAHGLRLARKLQADSRQREEQNLALARENERLKREISALEGNDRALERAAREELGLVKEGEVVFTF